jgi:hypothetical protein
MKGETRREPRMVLRGLARSTVAEEVVAARPSNRRRGPLEAATKKKGVTMTTKRMTNPASTSSKKLQKLRVLTGALRCIPLTTNINSGHMRLM